MITMIMVIIMIMIIINIAYSTSYSIIVYADEIIKAFVLTY